MKKTRQASKRNPSVKTIDSDDEPLIKKVNTGTIQQVNTCGKEKSKPLDDAGSSSESDLEDYLKPVDQIDLNDSFFSAGNKETTPFDKIQKDIFAGVTRLSDSDSESDIDAKLAPDVENKPIPKFEPKVIDEPTCSQLHASEKIAKLNFQQLQEFTNKIEEAKKQVEKYQAKKKSDTTKQTQRNDEPNMDISSLLAAGEKTSRETLMSIDQSGFHSSDFESCSDSDKEDWEEVKTKDNQVSREKKQITKEGIQITVEMPTVIRKNKKVDLLAAMKRRLNRIRKENQIYVHKVHLLCWIAHGNYVNNIINNETILHQALSLLPSQKSYPPERTDLNYLEQIVPWYRKCIKLTEKKIPEDKSLLTLLEEQISSKVAYNKKMFVYIFIALLRSLGIQCRLVLSFQVEPLRPPASDLHSLSTKPDANKKGTQKEKATKTMKKKSTDSNANETKLTASEVKSEEDSSKHEISSKEKQSSNVKMKSKIKSEQKSNQSASKNKDLKLSSHIDSADKNDKPSSSRRGKTVPSRSKKSIEEHDINEKPSKEEKVNKSKAQSTRNTTRRSQNRPDLTEEHCQMSKKEPETMTTDNLIPKINQQGKLGKNEKNKKNCDIKTVNKTKDSNVKKSKEPTKQPKRNSQKNKKTPQVDGIADSDVDEDTFFKLDYFYSYNAACIKNSFCGCGYASYDKVQHSTVRIPQIDGATDNEIKKSKTKINLNKLNTCKQGNSDQTRHSGRSTQNLNYTESGSEEEFMSPNSSSENTDPKKSKCKPNLKKLKQENMRSPNSVIKKSSFFSEPSTSGVLDVRNDIISLIKGRISEQKQTDKSKMVKKRKSLKTQDEEDDSDYVPEPVKKKHVDSEDEFIPKVKVKRRIPVKKSDIDRRVLSSDSEDDKKKKKEGIDVWAEVFLESEEKWISVDILRNQGQIHCINEIYARASHPVSYIVAWDNNNCVKDITSRYCNNYNTVIRKLRVDSKWWEETLKPFTGKKTIRDKEEDEELARQQLEKPLPTAISEYKNHPLYVLKRHLLKFEAIYPPDAPTLGFVRGEPVYSRDCVYTLHSREIWLKHAKVVKPGETPYKIVKARPKYDKLSNTVITDQQLEIFGPWQTMDYEPPTAENGIVPRNAYGNVELFKPCMLPKKTVHLKLPGLNKIARKLNIDCAAAIVGFDFHGGWSHPTYDGFVVCEEFEDQLVAAWELEQEEIERKEQEKVEKRVYDNWKKLIKGLLIRERLKAKYDFGGDADKKGKKKSKAPTLSIKKKAPTMNPKKKKRVISSSDDSDFN